MNRIEPIRRSQSLTRYERRAVARTPARWDGTERRRAACPRRPDTGGRTGLGDAAVRAAFEIHQLTSGHTRGLRADLAARGAWAGVYVASTAPRPVAPKLRTIT